MKKEIQNKKMVNKSGFSLIETIVAVFLITVGLIASVDLITKSLRESMDSRDQAIAAELGQEGIELVRNIRDNNWLQGESSFEGISNGNCKIDYNSSMTCSMSDFSLYIGADGYYKISSTAATSTKFKRKLIIGATSGDDRSVASMVIWNSAGVFPSIDNCNTSTKCAYAETILSKWGEGVIN